MVLVELQVERLQILVLLVAQIGHGELAHVVVVLYVAIGREAAVVGLYRAPGQKGVGNVLDSRRYRRPRASWHHRV